MLLILFTTFHCSIVEYILLHNRPLLQKICSYTFKDKFIHTFNRFVVPSMFNLLFSRITCVVLIYNPRLFFIFCLERQMGWVAIVSPKYILIFFKRCRTTRLFRFVLCLFFPLFQHRNIVPYKQNKQERDKNV